VSAIFRNIFVDSWTVRIGRFVYPVILVAAHIIGGVSFLSTIALLAMGFLMLLNLNYRMRKYFRIMPIRPWVLLLSEYVHVVVCMAVGAVVTISIVLLFSDNVMVKLNFILLLVGMLFIMQAVSDAFKHCTLLWHSWLGVAWIMLWIAIVPMALLYAVFGFDIVNDIIVERISGVYITSHEIFTNTTRMAWFCLLGFVVYVVSFFASLRFYMSKDYEQALWWM